MALEKCPYCGGDVSSQATKCPHCNKALHETKLNKKLVYGAAATVAAVAIIVGGVYVSGVQKEKRIETLVTETETSIAGLDSEKAMSSINELAGLGYDAVDLQNSLRDALLAAAEDAYQQLDFDAVDAYYDELDGIGYDTTSMREIEQYDQGIFVDARNVYDTIQDIYTRLTTGNYDSIIGISKEMDDVVDLADSLEINQESKIGQYLYELTTDYWYKGYKTELYHDYEAHEYAFLASTFAYVRSQYFEPLTQIEFPYGAELVKQDDDTLETDNDDGEDTDEAITLDTSLVSETSDTKDLTNESDDTMIAEETGAGTVTADGSNTTKEEGQQNDSDSFPGTIIWDNQPDLSNLAPVDFDIDDRALPEYIDITATITEDDMLCIFFTNTSDNNTPYAELEVIYKDADGEAIYITDGGFSTLPAHHALLETFFMPDGEFASISFTYEEKSSRHFYFDEVELTSRVNAADKVIILTCLNNSDVMLDEVRYTFVFWKGNSIVHVYNNLFTDVEAGESQIAQCLYQLYDDADRYEIYLRSAMNY